MMDGWFYIIQIFFFNYKRFYFIIADEDKSYYFSDKCLLYLKWNIK